MWRKESYDALVQFVECTFVLIAIPLGYLWDRFLVKAGWEYAVVLKAVLWVLIFLYAGAAGLTIFQAEKKDRAFEYLFSLPLSRAKILLCKIIPRGVLLFGLYTALILFSGEPFISTQLIYIVLVFALSIFFSLFVDSVVIGFLGLALMAAFIYFLWPTFGFLAWRFGLVSSVASSRLISFCIGAAGIILPFGLAFLLTFWRLDSRPLRLQAKSFYMISLPPVLFFLFLSLLLYRE